MKLREADERPRGRLDPERGALPGRVLVRSHAYRSSLQAPRLCAVKTQKQISDGVPHSQREQAPPPVFLAVVEHVTTLAKSLQISQPVIGRIMVKVRSRQHYPG
jgi:hypothetical protein